jgi:hypoxanthine phosphoribosyltransferase
MRHKLYLFIKMITPIEGLFAIAASILPVIFGAKPWVIAVLTIILFLFALKFLIIFILEMFNFRISWERVLKGVIKFIKDFEEKSEKYVPDLVIGVGRSGAIFGATLAANLGNKPFLSLHDEKFEDEYGNRRVKINVPLKLDSEELKNMKILITFAYVNSGETLRAALDYLTKSGIPLENIYKAILWLNPDNEYKLSSERLFIFERRRITKEKWEAVPWTISKIYKYR